MVLPRQTSPSLHPRDRPRQPPHRHQREFFEGRPHSIAATRLRTSRHSLRIASSRSRRGHHPTSGGWQQELITNLEVAFPHPGRVRAPRRGLYTRRARLLRAGELLPELTSRRKYLPLGSSTASACASAGSRPSGLSVREVGSRCPPAESTIPTSFEFTSGNNSSSRPQPLARHGWRWPDAPHPGGCAGAKPEKETRCAAFCLAFPVALAAAPRRPRTLGGYWTCKAAFCQESGSKGIAHRLQPTRP